MIILHENCKSMTHHFTMFFLSSKLSQINFHVTVLIIVVFSANTVGLYYKEKTIDSVGKLLHSGKSYKTYKDFNLVILKNF